MEGGSVIFIHQWILHISLYLCKGKEGVEVPETDNQVLVYDALVCDVKVLASNTPTLLKENQILEASLLQTVIYYNS